jgi:hypothetical protein
VLPEYNMYGSLLYSLCVDAILSFANSSTLVSRIMTTVTEFTITWVQTPSDYDFLVARTMRSDWAAMNLPVISRRGVHHLYTGYHSAEPNGEMIKCPYDCGIENRGWDVGKGKDVKVVCRRCKGSCTFAKVNLDARSLLGNRGIFKVGFPPPQRRITWTYPPDAPKVQTRVAHPVEAQPVKVKPPPTHLDDFLRFHQSAGLTTPPIFVMPPVSHAPSPSPSPSPSPHPEQPLTIRLPPRPSLHPLRPSRSASRLPPPVEAPPVVRSRSAPDVEVRNPITCLADLPPLELSTEARSSNPRKRKRDNRK